MSGSSGDKHDGPLASVHTLDPDRPKRRRSLPKAPAAPTEETPAPDRNAALSMLGTFDLDDVDSRSPDEILATLAREATVSEPDDQAQASPAGERAVASDIPLVEDVQSDEVLRELEEHHQRGQTTARPSAPRGSAEFQPALRRKVAPKRKQERELRGRASVESRPSGGRRRLVLSLAAAAVFTTTAMAVTLSQLGSRANRATPPVRSSSLAATNGFTLSPIKAFDTVANAIAKEERQLTRRATSPAGHHRRVTTVRRRSIGHHLVTRATLAPAASTSPATSSPSYSSSSSTAASISQPATSTPAAATGSSTSSQSQPAFGQDGSLGPGRGAAGTQ
jgi:hypothetical protein